MVVHHRRMSSERENNNGGEPPVLRPRDRGESVKGGHSISLSQKVYDQSELAEVRLRLHEGVPIPAR